MDYKPASISIILLVCNYLVTWPVARLRSSPQN
jgi:hypothetical protein